MSKLAFVMTGPQGGQMIEMSDEDFVQAEKDGWAIDFEAANLGGAPDPFAGFNTDPHPQAEAWMAKRGLYPTREMRADDPKPAPEAKPAAEPAAPKSEPKEDPKPKTGDKPKASPAKK